MKVKPLSELEQQVMNIIWNSPRSSVRNVMEKLDKDFAYTTVATILKRLYEKGIVTKLENKNVFLYSPKITREKYSKSLAQSFIGKLLNSFGDIAIASFANSLDNLPKKKRDYLLKLLESHDKNQ